MADERKTPIQTGLKRLRGVADGAVLAASLAPEPPDTFEAPSGSVHHNQQVSDATQLQAMREWASGVKIREVEAKYGLCRGYIREAMVRRFGSREAMLRALEGLILENAVGAQMIAQEKLPELTGAQAVFAGKLLVETMGNLRAQIEATPKTINFREFKMLGDQLKQIREIVGKPVSSTSSDAPPH